MKNFRTYDLAVQFYRQAVALPLKAHLKEQLLRAAASVALNLAEGRGKPSVRDQLRFFHIAMGSVRESQAILALGNQESTKAYQLLDSLAAHLYRLIQAAVG